jgi:hypothetical protein
MTDDKTKKTADAPRHSDEKGVNPTGAGPAQPRKPNDDQPGAASAGKTTRATEDTYD